MAIRVIIDGNTVNESINMNLGLLQSITGEYISAEDLKTAIELQPKSIECVGYRYTRDNDGRIEIMITDTAISRANAFTSTWAPAIAGMVMMVKAQVKGIKKLMKKFLEAEKGMLSSLKDNMRINGMSEDEWIDKSAKQWADHFDDVLKAKKSVEDQIESLSKRQDDLISNMGNYEPGSSEHLASLNELTEIAKKLGKLKAERDQKKAEKE